MDRESGERIEKSEACLKIVGFNPLRDRSFPMLSNSGKPISPLRQRMIDDMTARRFKEATQRDYVRHVRNFAAFLRRSPDSATSEDVRLFQVHLAQQKIGAVTINAAISALRFFFNVTIERPDLVRLLKSCTNRAKRRSC